MNSRVGQLPWRLLLVALLMLGAGLGLRDPWPADEPRFALIARDMVWFGDWLIPHRAGELYPDKPPLFVWTIAACYWLTGSLRLAFLLPSLLAGMAILALVHDLGRRLWGERAALFGTAALLFTVQFTDQARTAQIDALSCFWIVLGLYGLLRHLLLGPAWVWFWTACVAMGFGVITKGVGFLPLFLLLPYGYARWRCWPGLPALGGGPWHWLLGGLLFAATISLWLAPMLWVTSHGDDPALVEYRNNLLFHQTVDRYADGWAHPKPFWYYLVEVIPLFWLPLVLLLPWLVAAWQRRLRERDTRILLLLGYVGLVLVFFSFSAGKRGLYILPALPALALASAPFLPALWRRVKIQRLGFALTAGLSAMLVAAALYLHWTRPERLVASLGVADADLRLLLLGLGGIGLLAAWLASPSRGGWALLAFLFGMWQLQGWWAYPLFDEARSGRGLMRAAMATLADDESLAIVNFREQMLLQSARPITHFGYHPEPPDELATAIDWLLQNRRGVLLVADAELGQRGCFRAPALIPLGYWHGKNWFLARNDALAHPLPAACRAAHPGRSWTTRPAP
jgi:4-amino-4-deoxy-L-arabinose transferase-like glycosyltransferase